MNAKIMTLLAMLPVLPLLAGTGASVDNAGKVTGAATVNNSGNSVARTTTMQNQGRVQNGAMTGNTTGNNLNNPPNTVNGNGTGGSLNRGPLGTVNQNVMGGTLNGTATGGTMGGNAVGGNVSVYGEGGNVSGGLPGAVPANIPNVPVRNTTVNPNETIVPNPTINPNYTINPNGTINANGTVNPNVTISPNASGQTVGGGSSVGAGNSNLQVYPTTPNTWNSPNTTRIPQPMTQPMIRVPAANTSK